MRLTVLADENIAHLDDYFGHHDIHLVKCQGRKINQSLIDAYRPQALLIRSVTPINSSHIPKPRQIEFIGSATIGIDHVDDEFIQKHTIYFANAQGSSKHSVAQYVMTAILTTHPQFVHQKITLGIIGLGHIGSVLAKYAQDLGWDVLGYDPYLPKSIINNRSFDELLSSSDVISIHTPLTKTGDYPTYQRFDQKVFAQLKNNALLINCARGEIICQEDLLKAIDNNLKVILDVYPFEPMIDKIVLDNLQIATPHIAGYTLEGKLRGTDMIYQAFCRHFDLPIRQQMTDLLPPNAYTWQTLRQALVQGDNNMLKTYYDICQDDKQLRLCGVDGVCPHEFDRLRKAYPLRREWLF